MRRIIWLVLLGLCPLLLAACSDTDAASKGQSTKTSSADTTSASASPTSPPVPELIGTWDYEFEGAEAQPILDNFADTVRDADNVVVRLAFVDADEYWQGFLFDGELFLVYGQPEGDAGEYTIDGDQLAMTGAHGDGRVTFRWVLRGKELTLTAVEECSLEGGTECTQDRSEMDPLMFRVMEHTYVRSGNDVTF